MPIQLSEFEEGETEDSEPRRVYKFLAQNPSNAFTAAEIGLSIGAIGTYPEKGGLGDQLGWYLNLNNSGQLDRLVTEGTVRSKRVHRPLW